MDTNCKRYVIRVFNLFSISQSDKPDFFRFLLKIFSISTKIERMMFESYTLYKSLLKYANIEVLCCILYT